MEKTPKAVGHFYLVSMPGEVKDPTHGVNVTTSLSDISHVRSFHDVTQSILPYAYKTECMKITIIRQSFHKGHESQVMTIVTKQSRHLPGYTAD